MGTVCFAGNLAKRCARGRRQQSISVAHMDVRIAELWCVGQVEELGPKDKPARLRYRKGPLHRYIEVMLAWPTHDAHAAVAKVLVRYGRAVRYLGRSHESSRIQISIRNAGE
jgi:hypothetical protein